MNKTHYAKAKWFPYLVEHCIGKSAEGGSLADFRRSFWGRNAYVIRCRRCLFKVSEETFLHVVSNI